MDHTECAGYQRADRVDFDPRVRLEFRSTQLSSDSGLLVMRDLDDALGCPILRQRHCATAVGAKTPFIFLTGCFGSRSMVGWRDAKKLKLLTF